MSMRMMETNVEFVTFEAQDVITTSVMFGWFQVSSALNAGSTGETYNPEKGMWEGATTFTQLTDSGDNMSNGTYWTICFPDTKYSEDSQTYGSVTVKKYNFKGATAITDPTDIENLDAAEKLATMTAILNFLNGHYQN